jgi:microsomal epoxide hydrolase
VLLSAAPIERLHVRVSDAILRDLHERLVRTRIVEPIGDAPWRYGCDPHTLGHLVAHWRDRFDWRAVEARLARFEHVHVPVSGGLRLHVLHHRSPQRDSLPLLLIHGWPGSFLEFDALWEPLADPAAHGGSADDAFHVVCVSLPGYGFSDPPREPGWDTLRIAKALAEAMQRLGYARYGIQGGDWGAMVGSQLARLDAARCAGLHLNMVLAGRPPDEPDDSRLTDDERAALDTTRGYLREGASYQAVQTLEPDTLAAALHDSPAGLLGWLLPKFRTWSDAGGDVLRAFTPEQLLANATLYWVTGNVAASLRLYYETRQSGRFGPIDGFVDVPTGVARFPRELFRPPRRWAERLYRIVRWTEMPRGGHFAALEVPQLLLEDVRAFFRPLRGR